MYSKLFISTEDVLSICFLQCTLFNNNTERNRRAAKRTLFPDVSVKACFHSEILLSGSDRGVSLCLSELVLVGNKYTILPGLKVSRIIFLSGNPA